MKIKKFSILGMTKGEIIGVSVILIALILATAVNMRTSLRRSRDAQRKADIRSIYDALMVYQDEYGAFPAASSDGRIVACEGEYSDEDVYIFSPCDWYFSSLKDVLSDNAPYLEPIPSDPHHGKGARYHYISDQRNFQVYAALEGTYEDEYSEEIEALGLPCGNRICNFGRSNGQTPLDKSLQEYENELRLKED